MTQDTPIQNKLLETLVNELRKKTHPDAGVFLEELVRRVDVAYLQNLELELERHPEVCAQPGNWTGWHHIVDLQHVSLWSDEPVLFHVPYDKDVVYTKFDPEKHNSNYPLEFVRYNSMIGFYILASRHYTGKWYVGGTRPDLHTETVVHEFDVTRADKFKLFAGTASTLVREGIMRSNRDLRKRVTDMKELLEQKATELDALAMVWCTGSCVGGQFRFTEPQQITEPMLGALITNMHRLLSSNTGTEKFEERLRRYRDTEHRVLRRIRKHALEPFVEAAKKQIAHVRENSEVVPDVREITHCAPYITYGENMKSFSVDDALMYLLDKHVITARPGVDGSVKFFLLVTNLPGYYGNDIEISFKHIQEIYDAYHVKYGLVVWVAEHTGKAPSMGTFYVGEMKALGLWKPEWDTKA